MNLKEQFKVIIFLLAPIFILFSCSKSEQIIGNWHWQDGTTSQYLESGIVVSPDGWSGDWEIEGDKLIINVNKDRTRIFEILELSDAQFILREINSGALFIGTKGN